MVRLFFFYIFLDGNIPAKCSLEVQTDGKMNVIRWFKSKNMSFFFSFVFAKFARTTPQCVGT